MTSDEIVSRVLYRDGLMLVIDKPAGLAVHAGPRGGASLEDFFGALRFGLPRPPYLAHRLDRDTSGCLVLGRHKKALATLGKLFAEGAVGKIYWALVHGRPPSQEGSVDVALAKRSTKARGWWMEVDPGGQTAITDYRVVGIGGDFCWLELRPRTGRTHQIRAHLQHLGCPVVGDTVYGRVSATKLRRLHLHSRAVSVPLYPKRDAVIVTAPPPPHMTELLASCGHS